jgi:acyl carrier protein
VADVEAVFKKLRSMLADQLGIDENEISMESTLEELDADSLDIVEMVMAIEQEWDIEIPDEAAEELKTVGDAVKYIVRHAG